MSKKTKDFERRVGEYVEEHSLFVFRDRLLVALSGGADSVALLLVLRRLGYVCEAAHCNFRLRGEESVRDESFVRVLCQRWDVPLHVTAFDTREYAARQGISVEMAARELRYDWFRRLCEEQGFDRVAVAHHRDDSVETLLLNLIRGTGIHGLTGIRPRNGRVVRPLLGVSRLDILDYLQLSGETYVTDSTNLQNDFTRNRIRNVILPMMEEINPSVKQSIASTAERLRSVAAVYDRTMAGAASRVTRQGGMEIDIAALKAEEEPRPVLYEILSPQGFNAAQVAEIYASVENGEASVGRLFRSGRMELLRDRTALLLRPLEEGQEGETVVEGTSSVTQLPDGSSLSVDAPLAMTLSGIPRERETACLDAALVEWPLTLRHPRQGDTFVPFGMKGKKLVSDYLTDRKFSRFHKERQWVLCDARGRILWLVGERTDNRFRVSEKTEKVILMTYNKKNL